MIVSKMGVGTPQNRTNIRIPGGGALNIEKSLKLIEKSTEIGQFVENLKK